MGETADIHTPDPRRWVDLPGGNGVRMTYDQLSRWTMHANGIQHTPLDGREPNAFHRLTQRLLLGIRWKRTNT